MSRAGWLRAAVLGADDGIVSTASLIAGVTASGATSSAVLIAGSSAMVAGAMAMAAGEYVSVSSQADTETADLARERHELANDWDSERRELAMIYERRGLDGNLAGQVADQLMAHDALAAHAHDELGVTSAGTARPIQAAMASAASFFAGAIVPLLGAAIIPAGMRLVGVVIVALIALALIGALGARAGGARALRPALRVVFWGAVAMAVTAVIGRLAGTII